MTAIPMTDPTTTSHILLATRALRDRREATALLMEAYREAETAFELIYQAEIARLNAAKAVTKIAKVTPLPFVTLSEVPSVRIASDLTKAFSLAEVVS